MKFDNNNIANAAKYGHLSLCKWFYSHGAPLSMWVCNDAARGGHLEILEWARSNECPWGVSSFNAGMRNGNIEVVKYMYENYCPRPDRILIGNYMP